MNFVERYRQWRQANPATKEVVEIVFILLFVFAVRTLVFSLYAVPSGSMETTIFAGDRLFADKFTLLFSPLKRGDIISFNMPLHPYSENKLVYWWQMYVWGPINLTKRVIGIPGDHVQGKIEDGVPVVYLNEKKLDEPYVNKYPLIALFDPEKTTELEFRSYDPAVSLERQPFYHMTQYEVDNGRRQSLLRGLADKLVPGVPVGARTRGHLIDEFDVQLGSDEYWVMGDSRQNSGDARFWGFPLKRKFIHGKVIFRLWSIEAFESWGRLEWLHIWPFDMIRHPIKFWSHVRWSHCFELLH